MAHTPGPWELQGQWQLKTDTGDWVDAECVEAPRWGIIGAWIDSSSDERESNARLVAAAPELLEALRILRVQFGDYTDGDGAAKFHACNIADAAIVKAEGRAE